MTCIFMKVRYSSLYTSNCSIYKHTMLENLEITRSWPKPVKMEIFALHLDMHVICV